MIGDSLIRGWPAKQSEAAFPGQLIANLGIGGARTQGVLWLLSDPLVRALHPRQVVLLVTTNLAGRDPPCAIARGIESVIAAIDAEWNSPKLIVYKIPPRGKGFLDLDQDRRKVNQAIERDEVNSQNITFVDPSELLMKTAGAYQSDNIHFTSVGYDVLMQSLDDSAASSR
jgi:lysophospholipase L1-like esterase